jgi:hypothetical protein
MDEYGDFEPAPVLLPGVDLVMWLRLTVLALVTALGVALGLLLS